MRTEARTPIASAYDAYQQRVGMMIRPNSQFYERIGINRKRFAQLLRGEKSPTTDEIRELAKFFQINVTDLI